MENRHYFRIASIDFQPPYILTGSSDKHLRLIDMTTSQGWSTSPEYHYPDATSDTIPSLLLSSAPSNNARLMCQVCGSENVHVVPPGVHGPCVHSDLVRSVALGQDFVMSGSYDLSIKVRAWHLFFILGVSTSISFAGLGSPKWGDDS